MDPLYAGTRKERQSEYLVQQVETAAKNRGSPALNRNGLRWLATARNERNTGDIGSGISKILKGQSKESAFEEYFEIQRP